MLYVSQRTKEKLEKKKKKVIFYTSTSCVSLRNILAVVLCSIQVVKRIGIQNYKNTILWISAVSNSKLHNKIRQLTRFIKTNFQYLFSEPYNYSVYSWILFFLKLSLYWICTILLMLFMSWFLGHRAYGILAPRPGVKPTPSALEGEVLTTGPAGKSPAEFFWSSQFNKVEWREFVWIYKIKSNSIGLFS